MHKPADYREKSDIYLSRALRLPNMGPFHEPDAAEMRFFGYLYCRLFFGALIQERRFEDYLQSCVVELASSIVLAVALKNVGSFDLAEDAPSFTVMTGVSVPSTANIPL